MLLNQKIKSVKLQKKQIISSEKFTIKIQHV